ncbi:ABC transporter ATP-binding protein [Nitratifractor salsuginis]|uniref:ABC transporter related protein n=1 Tax=Nitratifractor salsuginis (strain DSM 16511 / JCM 12458 / E9I37-1) TaxID=749222 RepID=E6X0I2_NITSE|nr:ABC transporter related protein [Nitratifractor salsuginis DSM 16511]
MSMLLLEAQGLSHAFDYPLYDNVSMTIRAGESVAVMGRSGSGKSTLLHTLAGLIPPLEGEVRLFGQNLYRLKEARKEMLRRYETGVVFQHHYLFKGMSARENVEVAALLAKQPFDPELFDLLEISETVDQKVSELSGGQQQRVSLVRVLNKKPKLIFADEPTGNLDLETSELVMTALLEYISQGERALFLVTHDPEVARKCSRQYLLEDRELRPLS